MPTLPKFDPIMYLVARRYKIDWYREDDSRSAPSEKVEAAEAYEAELRALPPAEVNRLAAAARAVDAEEQERNHPFNQPSAALDTDYWARLAFWSSDEAVIIALDRDPRAVGPKILERVAYQSALARRFVDLREVVRRAILAGELYSNVTPVKFLDWAMRRQIAFPPMLATMVVALQPALPSATVVRDLKAANASVAALSTRVAELTKERDDLLASRAGDAKGVSRRERTSLLKLIAGMAATKYRFDAGAAKQAAAGNIARDLQLLGLDLDEDTVRKWLAEAAILLDRPRSKDAD